MGNMPWPYQCNTNIVPVEYQYISGNMPKFVQIRIPIAPFGAKLQATRAPDFAQPSGDLPIDHHEANLGDLEVSPASAQRRPRPCRFDQCPSKSAHDDQRSVP